MSDIENNDVDFILGHTPTAFRDWTLEDYREIARKAMMKKPSE